MPELDPLYYTAFFRRAFRDRLVWWRNWLRGFCYGRCTFAFMLLHTDEKESDPKFAQLKTLERWLLVLAFIDLASWFFVLRDHHRLLWLRRPKEGYRLAVYIISAATTIPSFILHIRIMLLSYKAYPLYEFLVFGRTLAIVQFLLACGVYLWMLHRFLLRYDDEHYEPITPSLENRTTSTPSSSGLSQSTVAALEPYSGSSPPSSSHESYLCSNGHLSNAYIIQRESYRSPMYDLNEEDDGQGSVVVGTGLGRNRMNSDSPDLSQSTTSAAIGRQQESSLRCPTAARFDYMPQGRTGPHSWSSYLLIPAILGTLSTISIGLIVPTIFENSHLAKPSPYAKCGLQEPLGNYLFCAYAIQRELRKSLFSQRRTSLPEPWIETRSLLGKRVFINSDTGVSVKVDPCLRAFPTEGQNSRAGIRSSEYFKAYNAGQSTCKEYWGHLGRVRTIRRRWRPAIVMFIFLGLASFQLVAGFNCIARHPEYILGRFTNSWTILVVISAFSIYFNAVYVFGNILSILILARLVLRG